MDVGPVAVETLELSGDTVVTSAAFASPELECLPPHAPATNVAMTYGMMVSFCGRSGERRSNSGGRPL